MSQPIPKRGTFHKNVTSGTIWADFLRVVKQQNYSNTHNFCLQWQQSPKKNRPTVSLNSNNSGKALNLSLFHATHGPTPLHTYKYVQIYQFT
jgi:hypothetical protein